MSRAKLAKRALSQATAIRTHAQDCAEHGKDNYLRVQHSAFLLGRRC